MSDRYPKSLPEIDQTQGVPRSLTGSAVHGLSVISLDDLSVDPAYDITTHHSGCATSRGRDCTCEYLGQWT